MKKNVILLSIILIGSFAILVYYASIHSRGVPVVEEKSPRAVLNVDFLDKDIDLAEGISLDIWDSIAPTEVKLMYQVMVLPWPKPRGVVLPIMVKTFHNYQEIYFYLTWSDDTEDKLIDVNKFSDGCAIMFPLGDEIQPSSIMMGFLGKSNFWQWKASQDNKYWLKEYSSPESYADFYYPFEEEELFVVSRNISESAVNDLMAIRVGTVTLKEIQNVSGRGFWKDGTWQVVFKRSLSPLNAEVDPDLSSGKKLCAFAVWNGSKGDRGGRKSISDWVELNIK